MIKLDADESMLLLITKNWEHKDHVLPCYENTDIRINDYRGSERYIQECCNVRCYGRESNYSPYNKDKELKADVYGCYRSLFEKLLTSREILRAFENSEKKWRGVTFLQELFGELSCLEVKDKIELDYSMVDHTGKDMFFGDES